MNLRWRWLLTGLSTLLYACIPVDTFQLWGILLFAHAVIGALRQPEATLTSIIVMLAPLISIAFLTPSSLSATLGYVWLYPLIPMAFLFPDMQRVLHFPPIPTRVRDRPLISLSGLSLAIGDGIFQVVHGCFAVLYALRQSVALRQLWNAPVICIPCIWLILGMVLRYCHNGHLDDLSTASAWIWGPILGFTFSQLSPVQIALYVRMVGVGITMSAIYGVLIKVINPLATNPLIAPLLSLGSTHQGMTPGSSTEFAAGGFFFHRLKFAHQSSLLLLSTRLHTKGFGYAMMVIAAGAIIASGARWAALIMFSVGCLFIIYRYARLRRTSLLWFAMLGLLSTVVTLYHLPSDIRTSAIHSQRSFETRQIMYQSAMKVVENHSLGLGHGGFKRWSQKRYPIELNNLELPRTLPHNFGLATLTETGPLGWALMVLLIVYVIEVGCRGLGTRLPQPAFVRILCGLTVFGALVFLGLGILHDPLYHKPVAYSWMMILGLTQYLRRAYSI